MIAIYPGMDFFDLTLFEILWALEFVNSSLSLESIQPVCLNIFVLYHTLLFFWCYNNTNIKLLVLPHISLCSFFPLNLFSPHFSDCIISICLIFKFTHIFLCNSHTSMKSNTLFLAQKLPFTSLFLFLCQDLVLFNSFEEYLSYFLGLHYYGYLQSVSPNTDTWISQNQLVSVVFLLW